MMRADQGAHMDSEQIAYDVADRVLNITLDRPDVLSAFTARMRSELIDAFDRADADDDVRVVIVTGRGRGFCAGADLSAGGATCDHRAPCSQMAGWSGAADIPRDGVGQVVLRIFVSIKPVIAAIN